jgi:hypothetical protein
VLVWCWKLSVFWDGRGGGRCIPVRVTDSPGGPTGTASLAHGSAIPGRRPSNGPPGVSKGFSAGYGGAEARRASAGMSMAFASAPTQRRLAHTNEAYLARLAAGQCQAACPGTWHLALTGRDEAPQRVWRCGNNTSLKAFVAKRARLIRALRRPDTDC